MSETLDEFDKEFNILVADDDEKAAEAERLKQVEEEINEQNDKYANGESSFGAKLYEFSDLSKGDFEKAKLGASGWDRPGGRNATQHLESSGPWV